MNKTLTEQLKEYFKNTPQEQIEKDWKETEKYDQTGITIEDYQKEVKELTKPFEEFTSEDFDVWDN
jgi:hypothetical protein